MGHKATALRHNRDYILLWSGQTVSAVGSQLSGLVFPLLVLSLTRSPAQAGLVGVVEGVPYVMFGHAAGVQRRLSFAGTVIGSGWALSLLFPLLAIAPNPAALGLVRTAMSGVVSIFKVARLSYPLAQIPDALQGRINGLTSLIAYGSLPIGQALTGVILRAMGPGNTIVLITACLIVLATATTASSAIRHAPAQAYIGQQREQF